MNEILKGYNIPGMYISKKIIKLRPFISKKSKNDPLDKMICTKVL